MTSAAAAVRLPTDHILANHEWDARALLSLVLVGLPETRDRLSLHKNRSLWSRIHTRMCLGEASPADTAEYVAYRMKSAGCEREVFSSDASPCHKKRVRIVDRDIVARVQKAEDDDAT